MKPKEIIDFTIDEDAPEEIITGEQRQNYGLIAVAEVSVQTYRTVMLAVFCYRYFNMLRLMYFFCQKYLKIRFEINWLCYAEVHRSGYPIHQ